MAALTTNPLYLITVLGLVVVVSEWLCRRGVFRHLGSALLVILLGALLANLGVIPASSPADAPVVIYDAVFAYVAPISIFWLLLSVNLRDIVRAGLPLLVLFLVGSAGSVAGAVAGFHLARGAQVLGQNAAPMSGMFAATYIGGSVNFNAIALHYDVVRDGLLYGGAVVVDNIMTTVWIVVTLLMPRFLAPLFRRRRGAVTAPTGHSGPIVELAAETERVNPSSIAVVLALGTGALLASTVFADALAGLGFNVPMILIITVLALVLAQFRVVNQLAGARALAMFAVYVFLTVIGAFCDVRALPALGAIGMAIFIVATSVVVVHGAFIGTAGWLMRSDPSWIAVASQANVGGSTSALALAKSLGREDLLVPGILLGALGNAIGTFLGFGAIGMLR